MEDTYVAILVGTIKVKGPNSAIRSAIQLINPTVT